MEGKPLITPAPEGSVPIACPACGEKASITKMNKNNPGDVVLAAQHCLEHTTEYKVTAAKWNDCCGSFNMYEVQLIKTHKGLPYAGIKNINQA